MTDKFPAKITKNGNSKSVTVPYNVAEKYEIGEKVRVTLEKVK